MATFTRSFSCADTLSKADRDCGSTRPTAASGSPRITSIITPTGM
jgi:hypothetical protein